MTLAAVEDGMTNIIAGLGQANPKTAGASYVDRVYSQHELETAYRTSTWLGKIVDIPADDATREWRGWQAEKDEIEALEAEEKRLDARGAVRKALIWSRLYGGAVILPIGLPGRPEQPLALDRIGKGAIKHLTVLHRYEINPEGLIRDPLSPHHGEPERYVINTDGGQVAAHPSRVIRINGRRVGSDLSGQSGWGDPVWTQMADAVLASDQAASVVSALLAEAKIDVIKQQNLASGVTTEDHERALIRRYQLMAMLKSIANVTLLDGTDEWSQKQITWTGLPDVVMTLLNIMSGAADIPMTRLLGSQAKGLSNGGDADLKNYYDGIKSKQELVIEPALRPLDEMLIRSALGGRDPSIWYQWRSLWQMSEKERAEIEKSYAEAADKLVGTGLIPEAALAEGVRGRMLESGAWPGLEQGLERATSEPMPHLPEEPDEGPEAEPPARPTGDAAPRTLYVQRKLVNAAEFLAWAKSQGFETTVPADDLHVTVAFSRQPVDWMKAGQAWGDENGRLTVPAGGARLVEPLGDKGAVVLLFSSSELSWRHEAIRREAGASWDFPEYQPHVTITYAGSDVDLSKVEPYRGKLVFGPEIFGEVNEDWKETVREVKTGDALTASERGEIIDRVTKAPRKDVIERLWRFLTRGD